MDQRDLPLSSISRLLNSYTIDSAGRRTQNVILNNGQQSTMSQVIEADQNLTLYPESGEAVKEASRRSTQY